MSAVYFSVASELNVMKFSFVNLSTALNKTPHVTNVSAVHLNAALDNTN